MEGFFQHDKKIRKRGENMNGKIGLEITLGSWLKKNYNGKIRANFFYFCGILTKNHQIMQFFLQVHRVNHS